jgi:hypothetical protein
MPISFTVVESTPYRMIVLVRSTSTGGEFPVIGGTGVLGNAAMQARLADDPSGPLRAILRARTDGIGTVVAGTPLNQAQSRCILQSDNSTSVGNDNVPHAVLALHQTAGAGIWSADADVDVSGDPVISVTSDAVVGTCYLDIHVRHSKDL